MLPLHICRKDNPKIVEQWSLHAWKLYINVETIKCALLKLPNKLAAGIDGKPAMLLKNFAESLLVPFHELWQKSYKEGLVPVRLKSSLIMPQLKPRANKSDPSSFVR